MHTFPVGFEPTRPFGQPISNRSPLPISNRSPLPIGDNGNLFVARLELALPTYQIGILPLKYTNYCVHMIHKFVAVVRDVFNQVRTDKTFRSVFETDSSTAEDNENKLVRRYPDSNREDLSVNRFENGHPYQLGTITTYSQEESDFCLRFIRPVFYH